MNKYVNPKICLHRTIAFLISKDYIFAKCDICELSGAPVKAGRFLWWSKSRATRQFFKTANKVD